MSSVSILELASMARAFGALTQSGPPLEYNRGKVRFCSVQATRLMSRRRT